MTHQLDIPAGPPIHMRRDRIVPSGELEQLVATQRMPRVSTPFGSAWLATRHEDVRQVLSDPSSFSTAGPNPLQRQQELAGQTPSDDVLRDGFLVSYDPPEHTRLRRMLTPEFTLRRMKRIEPRVTEIIHDHLDAMERTGPPADLVSDYALPVPSLVICELLGVPYADREVFQQRTAAQLDWSQDVDARVRAFREMREYMSDLAHRQADNPDDNLLGMLVREHSGDLTHAELTGIAQLLLVAGHETTSNMLGMGTLLLLENPDQLALFRDENTNVGNAVEEMLRFLSVVHTGLPRITTREVELAGHTLSPGDLVLCSLPMANRDAALIADGGRLDLTRTAAPHVAFGHGIHHCLGAPLARMEMRIGFPALLNRFPDLRLAIPAEDVPFRPFSPVHGVRSLPVTW